MKSVRLKIPGKVMLAGEYAVLRGGHALAVTLDRYMTIEAKEIPTHYHWTIESDLWSEPKIVADLRLQETDPLRRAVQASAKKQGLFGGELNVKSDLNINYGIGSSSALRLGVAAAFDILKHGKDAHSISGVSSSSLSLAMTLQAEAQSQASGYDLVTQYVGALVEFHADFSERDWKPHWFKLPTDNIGDFIHVIVGGRGAPTTQTLQTTSSWLESGSRSERLIDLSENLIDAFVGQIRFPDPANSRRLIQAVSQHRNLFAASPNFPTAVAEALASTPGLDQTWTWKTTGAGGEDALLLIGNMNAIKPALATLNQLGWSQLDCGFTNTGIRIDQVTEISKDVPLPLSGISSAGVSRSGRPL